jgi:hypothetical protein
MAEISVSLSLKGFDAKRLAERAGFILDAYGTVMDKQLKEEIKTVQFPLNEPWPRKTRRRNGTTVGSPRDIVDLGGLLKSQRKDFASAATFYQLTFTWNAKSKKGFPYAGLILNGYIAGRNDGGKSGTVVPGRNWIKPALDKHPLDAFFIREWRKLERNSL